MEPEQEDKRRWQRIEQRFAESVDLDARAQLRVRRVIVERNGKRPERRQQEHVEDDECSNPVWEAGEREPQRPPRVGIGQPLLDPGPLPGVIATLVAEGKRRYARAQQRVGEGAVGVDERAPAIHGGNEDRQSHEGDRHPPTQRQQGHEEDEGHQADGKREKQVGGLEPRSRVCDHAKHARPPAITAAQAGRPRFAVCDHLHNLPPCGGHWEPSWPGPVIRAVQNCDKPATLAG